MTNWTTTPPTEPGWYWYRDFPRLPEMHVGEIKAGGLFDALGWRTEVEKLPGEWWPERIQEPDNE